MSTRGTVILLATLALAVLTGAPAGSQSRRPSVSWWVSAPTVPVPVYVNGTRLSENALMLKGVSRTVLPMRALFSSLGARVYWDATQRAVYGWKDDGTGVRFEVGDREAQSLIVGGAPGPTNRGTVTETRRIDAPAMLISSRIYVPIRAATHALNADVRWVGSEPAVYIRTDSSDGLPESAARPSGR